jgi:hypothetical protein
MNLYFFNFIIAEWSAQLGIYFHPQNEWEAGNTIALLPTTLPRRQEKGMVRNHALHILYTFCSLTNLYLFNYILAG